LKEYKDVMVSGIDISGEMIKKAAAVLGGSTELIIGDSDNLQWKDNTFDVIVCNASFHHYPDPRKVLKEMRRVLRPDGRVIIADPWWPNPRRLLVNLFLRSPLNTGGDVRIYSEKEMRALLLESGFRSVQWEAPGRKYGIVCAVASKC
jgi:SAM-dependent methyltransferase